MGLFIISTFQVKMLTIKAEIQQDKQRSDGTYNVKMRFTLDRKVKRLSTNLFVPPTRHYKSFKFKENTPIKKEIDSLVLRGRTLFGETQAEVHDRKGRLPSGERPVG